MTLREAMARKEGFGLSPLNRPTRNNNPGNIEYGAFARKHGGRLEIIPRGLASRPRFAHFPSEAKGWEAMRHLLLSRYKGLTLKQAIFRWAPPTENDSQAYVQFVSRRTGLKPQSKLTEEVINA